LELTVIVYNRGNLWRRLALPKQIDTWSLTSLQQRLVKTGGRLVKHARYYWLLLAEGHLTPRLFGRIVWRLAMLPGRAGQQSPFAAANGAASGSGVREIGCQSGRSESRGPRRVKQDFVTIGLHEETIRPVMNRFEHLRPNVIEEEPPWHYQVRLHSP
jgi:hypothetical protein